MTTAIKRLHHLSGIVIASFLLLHVTNHLFALGGPSLHLTVMNLFRTVYRFPPIEILLILCVIFQIISGVSLVLKKGILKKSVYEVVQILSGLYLSFFMVYHLRAVMLGRYQWNAETDFYFAAGVANRYPEKLFFIPYYSLSLICIFAHIACVHYIKRIEMLNKVKRSVDTAILNKKYKRETYAICVFGGVTTFLIMIALSGVLYSI
jgi:succinate dehydrogenase/fumarate reductase cytochrome b subunit